MNSSDSSNTLMKTVYIRLKQFNKLVSHIFMPVGNRRYNAYQVDTDVFSLNILAHVVLYIQSNIECMRMSRTRFSIRISIYLYTEVRQLHALTTHNTYYCRKCYRRATVYIRIGLIIEVWYFLNNRNRAHVNTATRALYGSNPEENI